MMTVRMLINDAVGFKVLLSGKTRGLSMAYNVEEIPEAFLDLEVDRAYPSCIVPAMLIIALKVDLQ